jgi:electron transfer flavoprotein beta subunit
MRIVVCAKAAATLDSEFELGQDSRAVDEDALDWELNAWDEFALEAALEIRDRAPEGEVVVVTVGDEGAEDALLSCLAKGADRAIWLADAAFADADVLQVARALAHVVQREQPDLVLCGVQSSDAVNGATGVALAGFADLPHVAIVRALDYDHAGRVARVDRELEGGLVERMTVRTPAVITVQSGINSPRYATLRAIKQARGKPLEMLTLAELGLEDGDLVPGARVVRLALPERATGAEQLEGDPDAIAKRIADIVQHQLGRVSSS